jgi:hypothetical protein
MSQQLAVRTCQQIHIAPFSRILSRSFFKECHIPLEYQSEPLLLRLLEGSGKRLFELLLERLFASLLAWSLSGALEFLLELWGELLFQNPPDLRGLALHDNAPLCTVCVQAGKLLASHRFAQTRFGWRHQVYRDPTTLHFIQTKHTKISRFSFFVPICHTTMHIVFYRVLCHRHLADQLYFITMC